MWIFQLLQPAEINFSKRGQETVMSYSERELTMTSSTTFTHCALETTEFGEITQNKGHYAVQGHSMSSILVLESSYTTSY